MMLWLYSAVRGGSRGQRALKDFVPFLEDKAGGNHQTAPLVAFSAMKVKSTSIFARLCLT